jgi:hypothetical protein
MRGTGTIVNVIAVLIGGFAGMFLKKGLKERYQEILMQALGLATIFIGVSGALKGMFVIENSANGTTLSTTGTMLMIFSLVLGSILGEWIDLESKMEGFGKWLKVKFGGQNDSQFVEGFLAASLTICIGAMAIVGAIQDGMTGDASMLYAKAVLDGVIVAVFASAYGKGAIFSAIPVGIWQGLITIFAGALEPFFTNQIISDLSFVGNMLIFCVGVNLAFGKKFRVGNMLPSLIFVVAYDLIF